jgi:hypothetical protein
MRKLSLVLLFISLFGLNFGYGQTCNCKLNFEWMKKTFEENDAGFQYVIDIKGKQAYEYHNKLILEKVEKAKTYGECQQVLNDWLHFFRRFHINISLSDSVRKISDSIERVNLFKSVSPEVINKHEKFNITDKAWDAYLKNIKDPGFEGLWVSPPYTIGIIKTGTSYTGFVIDAPGTPMKKGHVKLKIFPVGNGFKGTIYNALFVKYDSVTVTPNSFGKNYLSVGSYSLKRLKPTFEDPKEIQDYIKYKTVTEPYIQQLSKNTVYMRIPSFIISQKKKIDSVLTANHQLITSTPNLIIDIRNNGGGSDDAYNQLIPYLYTNPIRNVAAEIYSTPLNNQRQLELSKNTDYDEKSRKEFADEYELLNKNLGKLVLLNKSRVTIDTLKKVLPYPKNIGVLMNRHSGSTAEEFLVTAKQSKKVKLFGVSSLGSLDISNVNSIQSPSKEFVLRYCLSKSLRIPDYVVDASGIQPDYYIDNSIPEDKWVEFVDKILNGE